MHRFLIAMAIIVGVFALGAVGLVVYKSASNDQTAVVASTDETVDASTSVKPAARAVRDRALRTVPAVAAAVSDEEPVSAAIAETAVTGSLDVNAFLKSLSPEDERALARALMDKFMRQQMQDRRYQLPVNGKFRALDRLNGGKLRLTDAQQSQLNNVMAGMKPKMDAALQSAWAQQDQLRSQMGQIFSTATDRDQARQQAMAIRQQLTDLNTSIQPQQDAFNQEVMSAMTPYLTQDQVQALSTMPEQTGGGPGFGPGGGGGPPGGGQPGGGGRRGGNAGAGGGGGN
jgi:hypothetical protein